MRAFFLVAVTATVVLVGGPVLTAAQAAPPAPTASATVPPTAAAPANSITGGKKKACDAQWKTMSDADKAKYKDQAKGMKSKKGNPLNGYNVYTSQCTKK